MQHTSSDPSGSGAPSEKAYIRRGVLSVLDSLPVLVIRCTHSPEKNIVDLLTLFSPVVIIS